METIDYNGVQLHRWNCGPSTYLARPELGARLINWNLRMADGSVRDVIHWPEATRFENFAHIRGGNPILFPFCGRTFHKGQIGLWRDQKGAVRPMPNHGIARDGHFEMVSIDEISFTAELQPDTEAKAACPFNSSFTVH